MFAGVFATVEHFFCSYYYAHLGKYLLNRDYIMIPFAEIPRCQDFLFQSLGRSDRLFVRPDSPLKLFTGMTISRSTFERDIQFMGFYDFPREALVVVSSPKTIVAEWRYVIADRRVVAGSQYMDGSTLIARSTEDSRALAFAQSVLESGFEPDPVWVLDVCKTDDGQYHLLEIGGFSFAGLYACDKEAIVGEVSKVAARLHEHRKP
ncbi:MAG: ATP-grasp domain-containing protein [Pirellulales bacterium]